MIQILARLFSFLVLMLFSTQTLAEEAKLLCTEEDQRHIFKDNHPFAEALYKCSSLSGLDVHCFADTYKGISDSERGISEDCTRCYSKMTKCTIDNCSWKCMWSPKGLGCRDCAHQYCGEKLEKCTGFARDVSPDFDRST